MPQRKNLEACGRCGWDYPVEILSTMIGALIRSPVCGICALEMRNAIHGDRRKRWSEGSQAEWNRLDALDWRKKHRDCAPKASAT